MKWISIHEIYLSEDNVGLVAKHIERYLKQKTFVIIRNSMDQPLLLSIPEARLTEEGVKVIEKGQKDPTGLAIETDIGTLKYNLFSEGTASASKVRIFVLGKHIKMEITHYDDGQRYFDTYITT